MPDFPGNSRGSRAASYISSYTRKTGVHEAELTFIEIESWLPSNDWLTTQPRSSVLDTLAVGKVGVT